MNPLGLPDEAMEHIRNALQKDLERVADRTYALYYVIY